MPAKHPAFDAGTTPLLATQDDTGREALVRTVLGPVPAESLGITLAHEHLLIDLSCLWTAPTFPWQASLVDAPITLGNRGILSLDPYVSRANMLLQDVEAAGDELGLYAELGGRTVVDLTVHGIGPYPRALVAISKATGVNVVMGCGIYVRRGHPGWVSGMSEDDLFAWFMREIEHGVAGTDIRPGIIGEIGTSSPVHEDERRVLRAAARAQVRSGLALNIHVPIFAQEALNVLDIVEEAGGDLERVVISHLDENLDLEYHLAVLERGAYVEFDTFGSEVCFQSANQCEPSDTERIRALARLAELGWRDRLLLSQDVCTAMQLVRYGGLGYGHILRTVVPRLLHLGIDSSDVSRMLVANPARILSIQPGPSAR